MSAATKVISLKGLTHAQILAETDHLFTQHDEETLTPHGSMGGPECFRLNQLEFHLVNQLEQLEDAGASSKQQKAVILQIRAVIRSMQALGCVNTVEYPR